MEEIIVEVLAKPHLISYFVKYGFGRICGLICHEEYYYGDVLIYVFNTENMIVMTIYE